jgi:hypothetical protein
VSSVNFGAGAGAEDQIIEFEAGIQTRPTGAARAAAASSRYIKMNQIIEGRDINTITEKEISLHFVIDVSGSMAQNIGAASRLDYAKAIIAAAYCALSPKERSHTQLYAYSMELRKIEISELLELSANGGTNINVVQAAVSENKRTDRWLVVTDGAIGDSRKLIAKKLCILALDASEIRENTDPRVVMFNPVNMREMERKIKAVLH